MCGTVYRFNCIYCAKKTFFAWQWGLKQCGLCPKTCNYLWPFSTRNLRALCSNHELNHDDCTVVDGWNTNGYGPVKPDHFLFDITMLLLKLDIISIFRQ